MKIFITGASGQIGFAVAAACARAGHEVSGLTRSDKNAARLALIEVKPIIGNMRDPQTYLPTAYESQVLIHCAAEYSADFFTLDQKTCETLIASAEQANLPRTFIYTSGCWVYGNLSGGTVDEASPLNPLGTVKPRVEIEKFVLNSTKTNLHTIVLRPGCVYGGSGGLTATWFESATKTGAAKIAGSGENRWAMIHCDDLADLYLRAAESAFGREVFNASDRSRATVLECAQAASRAAGRSGKTLQLSPEKAREEFGPISEGLLVDQHIDSSKAVRFLGWQPRHGGFRDYADRYYQAWKAYASH